MERGRNWDFSLRYARNNDSRAVLFLVSCASTSVLGLLRYLLAFICDQRIASMMGYGGRKWRDSWSIYRVIEEKLEIIKSNEKNNKTLVALMPILSVEDLYCCIPMIISVSKVVSSSWSFGSTVLGQMTYLVASSTLNNARSYVMQGASFTQRTVSSIPIGGNISPGGFSPSILLVVILVTVVIVVVILVVVVVVIVGVVIVVAIIGIVVVVMIIGVVVVVGGISSIVKLSFVTIGFLHRIMFCYLIH
ncbi:hypothetical protein Tco_0537659 [Tanacetum coccineum]